MVKTHPLWFWISVHPCDPSSQELLFLLLNVPESHERKPKSFREVSQYSNLTLLLPSWRKFHPWESRNLSGPLSQLIQVLLSWIDDHPSKDLKLCVIAQLFCLQVRRTFPHNFWRVLPHRKTMQLFLREVSPIQVIFSVAPAEMRDSNIFVYRPRFNKTSSDGLSHADFTNLNICDLNCFFYFFTFLNFRKSLYFLCFDNFMFFLFVFFFAKKMKFICLACCLCAWASAKRTKPEFSHSAQFSQFTQLT